MLILLAQRYQSSSDELLVVAIVVVVFIVLFVSLILAVVVTDMNHDTTNVVHNKRSRPLTQLPDINCEVAVEDEVELDFKELHILIFEENKIKDRYVPATHLYVGKEVVAITKYGIQNMRITRQDFMNATAVSSEIIPKDLMVTVEIESVVDYFSTKLSKKLGLYKTTAWVVRSSRSDVQSRLSELDFRKFSKNTVFDDFDFFEWPILYDLFLNGFQHFDSVYENRLENGWNKEFNQPIKIEVEAEVPEEKDRVYDILNEAHKKS